MGASAGRQERVAEFAIHYDSRFIIICVLLKEFHYDLPAELIAQAPLAARDTARMMVLNRGAQQWRDGHFTEISALLKPGDLLVFNNTKVFPARLLGRRRGITSQPIGRNNPAQRGYLKGETELLLTRQESEDVWQGLVHPGRKVRTGEVLVFGDGELEAEILGRGERGVRRARLRARTGTINDAIDRLGHVPLPPYIQRPDTPGDCTAYQTVYAKVRGAVAAPTAGLHFTPRVLSELAARGVESCEITLHVGLGTFQPVRVANIEHHHMEPERYEIPKPAAIAINRALDEQRRVIAVGTTSVRTLESSAAEHGGRVKSGGAETRLFIFPGFQFRTVSGLLTNFHLPESTLLMLVIAFAGMKLVMSAYRHAIDARYRFYSYGDCMLIL